MIADRVFAVGMMFSLAGADRELILSNREEECCYEIRAHRLWPHCHQSHQSRSEQPSELSAVCDVKPEAMEALLAKHGLEQDASIRRYTDYKEMVETEKPTPVGIATESGIHAEIALYCIAHGVNVIIESPWPCPWLTPTPSWKPRSGTMSRCAPAIKTASTRQCRLPGRHWRRAARQALPRVYPCALEPEQGLLRPGSLARHLGPGRRVHDEPVHPRCGSAALMMGDEVEGGLCADRSAVPPLSGVRGCGHGRGEVQNGAIGTIEGTTNVYPKNLEETLYLFGETGTVKIGGTSTNNIDVWDFADQRPEDADLKGLQEATSNVYGNGHTRSTRT